jgi:uridine kinase
MTHGTCLSTDPRLTDYDLLLENINGLRAGKDVEIPIYDFKLSRRVGFRFGSVSDASVTAFHILRFCNAVISSRCLKVPPSRIVVIEGIYALSEKLRPFLDLRVAVKGGVHFDLVKRVLRDINRAGQEPEEIIHQISETVRFVIILQISSYIF